MSMFETIVIRVQYTSYNVTHGIFILLCFLYHDARIKRFWRKKIMSMI